MAALVTDTHAAVWYLSSSSSLSKDAEDALDEAARLGDPVYLASVSLVEVTYLVEKGRLSLFALHMLNSALNSDNAHFVLTPLDKAVAQTVQRIPRHLVPDMPDRIIAATALHLNLPLITRDRKIQSSGITTIW